MNKLKVYVIGIMLIVAGLIFVSLSKFTLIFMVLGSGLTAYGVGLIFRKKYGWKLK